MLVDSASSPPPASIAVVRGVSHSYQRGTAALAGVNLTVERDRLVALLGPNGSGKTTLLRILAGSLKPSQGQVERVEWARSGLSAGGRARVSYVPQGQTLDPEMTGVETLHLFAALYGLPRCDGQARIARLLAELELEQHATLRVSTYSGGLRQRLHLALGMIHEPDLLLLDEPAAGLDPSARRAIWTAMGAWRDSGRAVLVATHDLGEAQRWADVVIVFRQGCIVGIGSPQSLIDREASSRLVLDLGCAELSATAADGLSDMPGVHSARLAGRRLTVTTNPDLRDAVIDRLRQRGVAIGSYEWHDPDLVGVWEALLGADCPRPGATRRRGGRGGRHAGGTR